MAFECAARQHAYAMRSAGLHGWRGAWNMRLGLGVFGNGLWRAAALKITGLPPWR
jgi:hypothetical protein